MPNRINGTDPGAEPGASTRGQNKAHSGGGDTGSTYVIKVWGSFAIVPTLPDCFINANSNQSAVFLPVAANSSAVTVNALAA